MAIIPRENIEQILNATDIVDLVNSYVPLKRAGAQFRANCPFHNEKTPSFYVNPARQSFKCFGCDAGGDAITFVRDYENLPFSEAIRKLAHRAGIPLQEAQDDPKAEQKRRRKGRLLDVHREAAEWFHELLMTDPGAEHARTYLKSRGFGSEMAKNWSIGWMPDNPRRFLDWAREKKFTGRELIDSGICNLRDEGNPTTGLFVRFLDRLMFPVRNEIGDVIAFSGRQLRENKNSGKYINSPETTIFRKSRTLYALDKARKPILKEKAALLCEGQLDVISCHEQGIENALAPLGTAFTEEHARLLKRYTPHVIACYDADAAGVKASERLFRELAPAGLSMRVVCMPEGDDPDTFLKKHGTEAFRLLLDEAKEFFDFKLDHARELGLLKDPTQRSTILSECAEILAMVGDIATRENQINSVVAHLQTSSQSLREEIARIKAKPQRNYRQTQTDESRGAPVEATPMHRIVAFLCHLALSSATAQNLLGEQFETIHEAAQWIEGIALLESVLSATPDPNSAASVNAYIGSLPEADRRALMNDVGLDGAPEDAMQATEYALAMLSSTVLQKRDAAVKAALKQSDLSPERMKQLLEEAKELGTLMRGSGRFEFDDELPTSTYREKQPAWKKNWRKGSH